MAELAFDEFTISLLVSGSRPNDARLQDAHLAHLARLHESGVLLAGGPLSDPAGELRGLSILNVPPDEALRTILSIGNYVIGCAVEHQAEAAREPDPERDARLLERAGELPHLRAAMAGLARPAPAVDEAGFEHGLALLIEGVRANHAQLVTAAAGRPPGG